MKTEAKKLDAFQCKFMKHILRIRWPQTISYQQMQEVTGVDRASDEIRCQRWNWIGKTGTNTALQHWSGGQRGRGRGDQGDPN